MRKVEPLKLQIVSRKVIAIFSMQDGMVRGYVRDVSIDISNLTDRYSCKRCRYNFEFTGTYLGMLRIPTNIIVNLLYLFALGVPA